MGGGDIGRAVGNVTDAVGLTNYSGERALDAQTGAASQANATQRYIYDTTRADNKDWLDAGKGALGQLQGNFMSNWQQDPGYQFRLDEGNKAINAAASARGMMNSGAAMKELTRYGQDYASNEYNNVYNRQYNRLAALAGVGQTANAQNASAGQNYGNNVSQNQIGLGNAAASNEIGAANRMSGLLQSGVQAAGAYYGAKACDENLKDITYKPTKKDLEEMKTHLKAFAYKYKNEAHGKGEWIGIMAQDLEKSKLGKTLVFEKDGIKMIDLTRVLVMFLATMAEA